MNRRASRRLRRLRRVVLWGGRPSSRYYGSPFDRAVYACDLISMRELPYWWMERVR